MSDAEILAFIDLEGAQVTEGWKPTDHFDERVLIGAYRQAQSGNDGLYNMITKDKVLATLVLVGAGLVEHYIEHGASGTVPVVLSAEWDPALPSFMDMRARLVAQHVADSDMEPEAALQLYQLDSFLIGWLAHERYMKRDDA